MKINTADSYLGTLFAKAVTITLGADDDTLVLGGNGTSHLVVARSTFSADGGTGANTVTNAPGNRFAIAPTLLGF